MTEEIGGKEGWILGEFSDRDLNHMIIDSKGISFYKMMENQEKKNPEEISFIPSG
ncbi:hypothetical protein IIA15_00920 [candidate division TA06 bacterium]|nr:hypothetical protein [candidate division TA06 bacterium]